jgi:GNAT superfamily N-acetyltransferase
VGYLTIVRRKVRSIGVKNTISLVTSRVYDNFFHGRLLFFSIDLTEYEPDKSLKTENIYVVMRTSFEELTLDELAVFNEYGGSRFLTLSRKRFASGYKLFVTYRENEVAGASWIYEGGRGNFFMIPLAAGEFFVVAVFILDSFRGKGAGTASLVRILEGMREQGFRRGFICTREWNFFKGGISKAGFQLAGKVREIKLFGKTVLIWSHGGTHALP